MTYIIGMIAKPLSILLYYIYQLVGNYGISLIILTAIVKFALYPLYAKQIKSTAKMSSIQPKMKQIQQKYANDKEMMTIKLRELYKEEDYNPTGGCLPMLIQMPIIFGLFALLRNPMIYLDKPEMQFAVHESFLWMADLSQADKWILPILAGLATYFATALTMKAQQSNDVPGMGNSMKVMQYVFPVMIVLMGRTFPGGLAIYWFFGQFLQIFFNLHLNKIRKELAEEANPKNKKGGKK